MFSEFRVFRYQSVSHSSVVFLVRREIILKLFSNSEGVTKTGKKLGFVLVVSCPCFFFHFVSSWSPVVCIYLVVCKCVIHPCFLTFVAMFSFFVVVVFLFIFIFAMFFTFHSVVCLCCLLSRCDKTQIKSHNIWTFDFHVLLRGLHPHTFTWPR